MSQSAPATLPNADARLESMSYAELLQRRAEIVSKGNGRPSELNDDDLTELVNIVALLRRRSSGPPKSTSKKSSTPAALDSLLDI